MIKKKYLQKLLLMRKNTVISVNGSQKIFKYY